MRLADAVEEILQAGREMRASQKALRQGVAAGRMRGGGAHRHGGSLTTAVRETEAKETFFDRSLDEVERLLLELKARAGEAEVPPEQVAEMRQELCRLHHGLKGEPPGECPVCQGAKPS